MRSKRPPRKSCGACTWCCVVLDVPELAKPAHTPCPHLIPGRGCGTYGDRPDICGSFKCGWLLGLWGDFGTRPDQTKVLPVLKGDGKVWVLHAPGVHEIHARKVQKQIKRWMHRVEIQIQIGSDIYSIDSKTGGVK